MSADTSEDATPSEGGMSVLVKCDSEAFMPRNWFLQWLSYQDGSVRVDSAWTMDILGQLPVKDTQWVLRRLADAMGQVLGDLVLSHVPAEDRDTVAARIAARFSAALRLGVSKPSQGVNE